MGYMCQNVIQLPKQNDKCELKTDKILYEFCIYMFTTLSSYMKSLIIYFPEKINIVLWAQSKIPACIYSKKYGKIISGIRCNTKVCGIDLCSIYN